MSDDDLERMTGEPHIDGYPLYSGLPTGAVQGEPVAWTLTEELERRETTCCAHLWFSNPQNDSWTALYASPPAAPSAPPDAELSRLRALGWEKVEQPAAPKGEPSDAQVRLAILALWRASDRNLDATADEMRAALKAAMAQPDAPSVPAPVIAGALFDLLGWLTSRDEVTSLHSRADAGVAVRVLEQWAALRGLSLNDARVRDWQQHAAPSVPDGWKLVPVEPTFQMLEAGAGTKYEKRSRSVWAAMINAAPKAPSVPASQWVNEVMAQAQVFASAWSLVGSPFDSGDALDTANEAKAELQEMLKAAPSVPAGIRQTISLLLADAMQAAVDSGANSVSMPDRYVDLAVWLDAAPEAPSAPPDAELARLRALVAAHREHPDCGDPLHPGCVDCEDGAAAAPSAPAGWIACSERMPEESTPVLAWNADAFVPCAVVADYKTTQWGPKWMECFSSEYGAGEVSHWMPLPAPPDGPER